VINTALLTPRNTVVIGLMAIVAYVLAKPLISMVEHKKDDDA
jgi:hypothetical protein